MDFLVFLWIVTLSHFVKAELGMENQVSAKCLFPDGILSDLKIKIDYHLYISKLDKKRLIRPNVKSV